MRWLLLILAAVAVFAGTVYVGSYEGPHDEGFDWELAALVLTGLGTTALAFVTAILAMVTRADVATAQQIAEASQETAKEAAQANVLARTEIERRPTLALVADEPRLHSRVETIPGGGRDLPCVRLIVTNEPGKRAAIRTRVLVDTVTGPGSLPVSLGSPSLGWPTAVEAADGSLTVFAGSGRPVNFGQLQRGRRPSYTATPNTGPWELHLNIKGDVPADNRQVLQVDGSSQSWIVRLVVGSDDGDSAAFDVSISWTPDAADPDAALDSVRVGITPVPTLPHSPK